MSSPFRSSPSSICNWSHEINAILLSTGPCPHHQLAASLHCASNTATISWTPGKGTLSYNASAESLTIAHSASCTTATSSCDITSLECSQEYRVSVSGQGPTCPSPASSWVTFNTGNLLSGPLLLEIRSVSFHHLLFQYKVSGHWEQ